MYQPPPEEIKPLYFCAQHGNRSVIGENALVEQLYEMTNLYSRYVKQTRLNLITNSSSSQILELTKFFVRTASKTRKAFNSVQLPLLPNDNIKFCACFLQEFPYYVVSSVYGCVHDFRDVDRAKLTWDLNLNTMLKREPFVSCYQPQIINNQQENVPCYKFPSVKNELDDVYTTFYEPINSDQVAVTSTLDKYWKNASKSIDEWFANNNIVYPAITIEFMVGVEDTENIDTFLTFLNNNNINNNRLIWVVDTFHSWLDSISSRHLNISNSIAIIDGASSSLGGFVSFSANDNDPQLKYVDIGIFRFEINFAADLSNLIPDIGEYSDTGDTTGRVICVYLNEPQRLLIAVCKPGASVQKIINYIKYNFGYDFNANRSPSEVQYSIVFNDPEIINLKDWIQLNIGTISGITDETNPDVFLIKFKMLILEYVKAVGDQAPIDILERYSELTAQTSDIPIFVTGDLLAYQLSVSKGLPSAYVGNKKGRVMLSIPSMYASESRIDIVTPTLTNFFIQFEKIEIVYNMMLNMVADVIAPQPGLNPNNQAYLDAIRKGANFFLHLSNLASLNVAHAIYANSVAKKLVNFLDTLYENITTILSAFDIFALILPIELKESSPNIAYLTEQNKNVMNDVFGEQTAGELINLVNQCASAGEGNENACFFSNIKSTDPTNMADPRNSADYKRMLINLALINWFTYVKNNVNGIDISTIELLTSLTESETAFDVWYINSDFPTIISQMNLEEEDDTDKNKNVSLKKYKFCDNVLYFNNNAQQNNDNCSTAGYCSKASPNTDIGVINDVPAEYINHACTKYPNDQQQGCLQTYSNGFMKNGIFQHPLISCDAVLNQSNQVEEDIPADTIFKGLNKKFILLSTNALLLGLAVKTTAQRPLELLSLVVKLPTLKSVVSSLQAKDLYASIPANVFYNIEILNTGNLNNAIRFRCHIIKYLIKTIELWCKNIIPSATTQELISLINFTLLGFYFCYPTHYDLTPDTRDIFTVLEKVSNDQENIGINNFFDVFYGNYNMNQLIADIVEKTYDDASFEKYDVYYQIGSFQIQYVQNWKSVIANEYNTYSQSFLELTNATVIAAKERAKSIIQIIETNYGQQKEGYVTNHFIEVANVGNRGGKRRRQTRRRKKYNKKKRITIKRRNNSKKYRKNKKTAKKINPKKPTKTKKSKNTTKLTKSTKKQGIK